VTYTYTYTCTHIHTHAHTYMYVCEYIHNLHIHRDLIHVSHSPNYPHLKIMQATKQKHICVYVYMCVCICVLICTAYITITHNIHNHSNLPHVSDNPNHPHQKTRHATTYTHICVNVCVYVHTQHIHQLELATRLTQSQLPTPQHYACYNIHTHTCVCMFVHTYSR